ncbi:kinesin [Chloropicon primus]|uniref:Kinesin-like protein n=1 Tax=Chloropicon primus TaxID=1764295 RepID=A0A5B8MML4_9CHLO|nr:kinesin [Chloropicon primus]UPR00848.1 kinesin [Chloropicon primus]|eukprot:QDZ21637.1 kinesin [Chloropicon primus]
MIPSTKKDAKKGTGIQVFARFRPQNSIEDKNKGHEAIKFDKDEKTIAVMTPEKKNESQMYTFDKVFKQNSTQDEVYNLAARPLIEDLFSGYYATVFAYGQTGGGKTYTMEGKPKKDKDAEDLRGVIPRAVEHIFDRIESKSDESTEYTVTVSYVEIYMEKIRDLLDATNTKNNLGIRVDLQRGVYVDGATEIVVNSDLELLKILERGSHKRHVSGTSMNVESSRSHAICMISLAAKNVNDFTIKTGKLFLVDLAGSEMVRKTGATDQRLQEAKQINKSLTSLGIVIKTLTERKLNAHVPYRDSKLTRILQDSLGGTSRASLIIACSPSSFNLAETVSTLRFGTRAKFIKNKPRVHVGYGGTEAEELLRKRDEEISRLKEQIAALTDAADVVNKENQAFRSVYGELPPDAELTEEFKRKPKLPQQFQRAVEYCSILEAEVFAISKEAKLVRHATSEIRQHIVTQRDVFGEARHQMAAAFRAPECTEEMRGKGREVDEILAMARWRSEDVLKSLRPLERASLAIEVAAKDSKTFGGQYHNNNNNNN